MIYRCSKSNILRICSWCLGGILLLFILYIIVHLFIVVPTPPWISSLFENSILTSRVTFLNASHRNRIHSEHSSIYYRYVTSTRNSSYPYISGDTFRAFADYIYDETQNTMTHTMHPGSVVFVKTDLLPKFLNRYFDNIKNPFVMVTHNSDFSAPAKYLSYLSSSKIIAWYASNPDIENHTKLLPIPIGLSNRRWSSGNLNKLDYAFKHYRKPWSQRTTLLYINFAVENNKRERTKALLQASKIEHVFTVKARLTLETYLQQVGNSKFVLSPPGNGLDCHRTWEALFMGAVPVVLKSPLDSLFKKTRTLIIDNWSELTQDFLLSFNISTNDQSLPDVLSAEYWRKTVFGHQSSIKIN